MKKRIIGNLLLATFLCAAILGFSACNNHDVTDRLDALESNVSALETKVEALEAANANFQQKLATLDTSSATFAEDITKLTADYNSLTALVKNAANVERVVVKKSDLESSSIVSKVTVYPSSYEGSPVKICFDISYDVSAVSYHLAICKADVTFNDTLYHYSMPVVSENTNFGGQISSAYIPNFETSDVDAVTVNWTEIVFYKFV